MVDLLPALHLRGVVGEVLVDVEVEGELGRPVHALVGLDRQDKVEDVIGVGEIRLHRRPERQLREIYFEPGGREKGAS